MAATLARFSWVPGGLAAALVIAVGRLASNDGAPPLELALYDRVQQARPAAASDKIVVVTIDEASLERVGDWPWPQDLHASLIERLNAHGARVIAFTEPLTPRPASRTEDLDGVRAALTLLESSDLGDSAQAQKLRQLLSQSPASSAQRLAAVLGANRNVIAPLIIDHGAAAKDAPLLPDHLLPQAGRDALKNAAAGALSAAPPATVLEKLGGIAHLRFIPDSDGVVRTDAAAMNLGGALLPSLATAIAAREAGLTLDQLSFSADGRLVLGRRVLPLDRTLRTRPQYASVGGAEDSFVQLAYWRVLGDRAAAEQVRDKIVIVGVTAPTIAGDTAVMLPGGVRTPAVLAAADTTSALLTGAVYARPSAAAPLEWFAAALVIGFAALLLPHAGLAFGALATVLLCALLGVTEIGLMTSAQLWVQLLWPSIAALAGYALYALYELVRRASASSARDPAASLRNLGQTFHKQGQLDLAFETYQRCPLDEQVMDILYQLGLDFERRRQLQKASAVYAHIATRDPNYRDLRARRARVVEEPSAAREAPKAPPKPLTPVASPPPRKRVEVEDYEPQVQARTSSGRTLGRYEIERELGKGAMGVVYLGRDPKINRVVAIKAIPLAEEFEESDLEEARARFFREAEMAGRLNHPAIVTVYDAGEDQGLAYIAMEYLRGQHLSHYADASRLLPPRTVMLLVARVAEALHYAHRQNVVHRDIKPANIMFNPDTDELKITDFGIARLTDTSRTKTGIVLGTPSFMSPEQLEGRPLDGRSDQFAVGVSLYQLLSGHLPFRAESMPRLMQKIATEPHAPVRVIRPELPEAVDAVLNRALAKEAEDRYENCTEFAIALRQCAEMISEPRREEAHEWLLP